MANMTLTKTPMPGHYEIGMPMENFIRIILQ